VSWGDQRNENGTYTEQEGEKDEEDFDHGAGLGAIFEELERDNSIVTKYN
jgi:hypothetical protein